MSLKKKKKSDEIEQYTNDKIDSDFKGDNT